MTRLLPSLGLCLGLALAGCTQPQSDWTPTAAPKQLKVDYVRLRHVANFEPGRADLAPGETRKLTDFLDTAAVSPQDHVYLEPADGDPLAAQRIGRLVHELDKHGIGATALPAVKAPSGGMVVLVERYVVTPPDCPNWTSPTYGDHSNQPPSNWGCADATNLSLMVADPRDLVVGRTLGPVEGDPGVAAVTRYRTDKVKRLYGSSATGDTFSSGTTGAPTSGGSGGGGQ